MTSPTLSPVAIQDFLIGGIPAIGAKLFVYAAGTITKIITYTDSTGGTDQTNPIVLNARGEPQNTLGASVGIWVPAGTPYKLVFTLPTDTDPPTSPIWTVDNIGGIVGGNGQGVSFDTVAQLEAAAIGSGIETITLNGYFTAGDGGGALYARASAGAGAGKVQSADGAWWIVASSPLDPRMLGATTSAPDNYAEIAAWLSLGAGQTVVVPNLTFNIASASLATGGSITLANNTVMQGPGGSVWHFKITGTTTAPYLFTSVTPVGQRLTGVNFYGNSTGTASVANGGLWYCHQPSGAGSVASDFGIDNCQIGNFGAQYWVYWVPESLTFPMLRPWFRNITAQTFAGNSIDHTVDSIPSALLGLGGGSGNTDGLIHEAVIDGIYGDLSFIKSAIVCFSGVDGSWDNIIVQNVATDAAFQPNCGAYTFISKDQLSDGHPSNWTGGRMYINGYRDSGWYIVGGTHTFVEIVTVGGTTTDDSTIPYGSLAIDDCVSVSGGAVLTTNAQFGVNLKNIGNSIIDIGHVDVAGANVYGLKIFPGATTTSIRIGRLTGASAVTSAVGFAMLMNAGTVTNLSVNFDGLAFTGGSSAFDALISPNGGAGTNANTNWLFTGTLSGAGLVVNSFTTPLISFRNFIVNGAHAPTNRNVFDVTGCTNLSIDGLTINGIPSGGNGILSGNAQARLLRNVSFVGIAAANQVNTGSFVTNLGLLIPTWSGLLGDYIQNLSPTQAASKITEGWSCTATTTWYPHIVATA